jgi:hypothetical protein
VTRTMRTSKDNVDVLDVAADKRRILDQIISAEPTDFKVTAETTGGKVFYVYCAFDAIVYHMLTKESIRVETFLRDKKAVIRIPSDKEVYVSFVQPSYWHTLPATSETPSPACRFLKFFGSQREFDDWKSTLETSTQVFVEVMNMEDAMHLVDKVFGGDR